MTGKVFQKINRKKRRKRMKNGELSKKKTGIGSESQTPASMSAESDAMSEDYEEDALSKDSTIKPKKAVKIPPIIINDAAVNQQEKLVIYNEIKTSFKGTILKISPYGLTIYPKDMEDHTSVKNLLVKNSTPFFTYSTSMDNDKKLVIKGLPKMEPSEIISELKVLGFEPKRVCQRKIWKDRPQEYPPYMYSLYG